MYTGADLFIVAVAALALGLTVGWSQAQSERKRTEVRKFINGLFTKEVNNGR